MDLAQDGREVNMDKHRTEAVYDDEISPLVTQIIEICKREQLPCLISVGMILRADHHGNTYTEDHKGTCDTLLAFGPDNGQHPELLKVENRHGLAFEVVRGHEGFDTAKRLMITG